MNKNKWIEFTPQIKYTGEFTKGEKPKYFYKVVGNTVKIKSTTTNRN